MTYSYENAEHGRKPEEPVRWPPSPAHATGQVCTLRAIGAYDRGRYGLDGRRGKTSGLWTKWTEWTPPERQAERRPRNTVQNQLRASERRSGKAHGRFEKVKYSRPPQNGNLLRHRKNPDRLCMPNTLRALDSFASFHLTILEWPASQQSGSFLSLLKYLRQYSAETVQV